MSSTKFGWLGTLVASLALLATAACQCASTVDGNEDSGVDAGSDAGCGAVGFVYGQNVFVDAVSGEDDTKCACGSPEHPCKSLTYCMQLIAEGSVQNVTLRAQISDGGQEWPVDLEPWPVHLGWGVTLEAPDIYFNSPLVNTAPWLFQVSAFDGGDELTVTIEGDPTEAGRYIHIGVPADDAGASSTATALAVPGWDPVSGNYLDGIPLILSNAWLHSTQSTMLVTDGASIQIGPLPVHFGSNGWQKMLNYTGSAIAFSGNSFNPSKIFDTGVGPVQIDDCEVAIANSGTTCDISLTHGPHIGSEPSSLFDGGCPPMEEDGVDLIFDTAVTLGSVDQPAVLSCQRKTGISVTGLGFTGGQPTDRGGIPRLEFTGTFKNQRCFGIVTTGGETFLTATTFQNSFGGVWALGNAYVSLDLPYPFSDFYVSQNDMNICEQPPLAYGDCGIRSVDEDVGAPPFALVGIDDPEVTVDFEATSWRHWDSSAGQPQIWRCLDIDYQECSCTGADCPDGGAGPLLPGADVVFRYDETNLPNFDGGQGGACH